MVHGSGPLSHGHKVARPHSPPWAPTVCLGGHSPRKLPALKSAHGSASHQLAGTPPEPWFPLCKPWPRGKVWSQLRREEACRARQGAWMRGRFCGPWSGVQSRPCGLHKTEGSGEQGRRNRSFKSCGLVYDPDEHLWDFLRLRLTSRQRSQHLVKTVL